MKLLLVVSKKRLKHFGDNSANKAFKSDSQRLAFSLRSSIAKRRSHLNAALADKSKSRKRVCYV
ncbi:hypothetical protein FVP00_25355 [Vibrio parahaemolyticus]|nr:hypothetical protein FVP00_25355 [Vibrio parahaemolyticus]